MERVSIEKRDREIVEKFRAVVDAKEHRKKIVRRRFFGVVLALICGCGVFFYNYFWPNPEEPVRYASHSVAVTRGPQPVDGNSGLSKHSAGDQGMKDPEATGVSGEKRTADLAPASGTGYDDGTQAMGSDSQASSLLRPASGLKSLDKNIAPDPGRVLTPRPGLASKSLSASAAESVSANPDIRIAEIVTCRGVDNRQPASRQKVFSMGKGEIPHVWMDVRSKKTPRMLRHVYYLNDREYCRVSLGINYARTRTWSNLSLKHPYQAGHWRVEVVTGKGDVLSRTEFTVVF